MFNFNSIVSVISLIASIVSLIVAIYYAREQIKLSKNMDSYQRGVDLENKRFLKNEIESKVIAFINKYQVSDKYKSDILLINLCVMALKYDRTFYYRREIYREFCSLSKDVQLEILKRVGSELDCDEDYDFYKNNLNLAIKYEAEFRDKYDDKDVSIFRNSYGKYLNGALIDLGSERLEDIYWEPSEKDKELYENWNRCIPKNIIDHITDILYFDDQPYMQPLQHIYHNCMTSIGEIHDSNNYLYFYLACWISIYLSPIKDDGPNVGSYYYEDYNGDKYFEDLFLEAMFKLYMSNVNS